MVHLASFHDWEFTLSPSNLTPLLEFQCKDEKFVSTLLTVIFPWDSLSVILSELLTSLLLRPLDLRL
jgi:hypothetical protein